MSKLKIISTFVLIFWSGIVCAESVLPDHLYFNNSTLDYVILVDKSKKNLSVYSIKNDMPEKIKEYSNVLLGENAGDKQVEGDKKTPEGVYSITRFIPDEKLLPIYGIGSYPLSYPNFLDKKNGKTGYGIWIHGVNDEKHKEFTQGCVAIQNNEMKELIDLPLVDKVVVISDTVAYADASTYSTQKNRWLSYLNSYIDSWESNNYDRFKTYIHEEFSNRKRQKAVQYLQSKKVLMDIYPYKKITVSDINVFKSNENNSVISFRQNYCAPNMLISGIKKLYVTKSGDNWSIIGEEFKNLPIDFGIKNKVERLVQDWSTSWMLKDIDQYIQYYSDDFKSKSMGIDLWKADKISKFEKTNSIKLDIEGINVRQLSPVRYQVRFKQRYQADEYSDIGYKTLILSGCPGDFKIVAETWGAI